MATYVVRWLLPNGPGQVNLYFSDLDRIYIWDSIRCQIGSQIWQEIQTERL